MKPHFRLVGDTQLQFARENGFTGHEFKVAAITGGMQQLLVTLEQRRVVLVTNAENFAPLKIKV